MQPNNRITYVDTALPTSGSTVTLVTERDIAGKGIKQYKLSLHHSHSGTVNIYGLTTDSATERLIQSNAVTPRSTPSRVTCDVEPYRQVIVRFTSSGGTQTTFEVNQAFSCEEPYAEVSISGEVDVAGTVDIGMAPSSSDRRTGKASLTTATSAQLLAVPGVGYRHVITGIVGGNSHASNVTEVRLYSGADTDDDVTMPFAAAGGGVAYWNPEGILIGGENEAINVEQSAAGTVKVRVYGRREAVA